MTGIPPVDLSVCLVSWNVWEDLRRCLQSLLASRGIVFGNAGPAVPSATEGGAEAAAEQESALRGEIIVVDNASTDGTVAGLRREFPQVQALVNAENRGFAAACNQALAEATGRYLFLLNPDTVVPADGLAELVRFADQHPEAGIIGPQLRYPDGRLQYSARHFPTIAAAIFRNTPLGRLFPRARSVQEYLMADWDHAEVREVDWVSGAAMLIRRELYEQIGPLDEEFFWGSEDVDYCWRAHRAGWQVLYTPTPRIIHVVGRSSDQAVARTIIHTHHSMYRLYQKHLAHNPLSRLLVWCGVWLRAGLLLLPLWLRQWRGRR